MSADGAEEERTQHRQGRAALLRLARWFDAADTGAARDLYAQAFRAAPARFLGAPGDETAAAAASWWSGPAVRLPPPPPDRPSPPAPVADHAAQRARLRDAAEARAHWRRDAAEEVRAALADGAGTELLLSGAALGVLMELLTAALGARSPGTGQAAAGDLELGIRLHTGAAPGAFIDITAPAGGLVLADLWLRATPYADHGPVAEPTRGEDAC